MRTAISRAIHRFSVPAGCFFILMLLSGGISRAQSSTGSRDFTTYNLEELMEMEITSAAKKPQTFHETASAVYVITREDIRRSGAVNLPEALRMAPGIQVVRSDPGDFAVTSRGFLGEWATKLLVLIDGRSVYSPFMSGVLWEYNDMLLENIERIEVIRGPGATLWGANAVNGVINIITRHAKDTQGGMAVATFSSQEGYDGLRYGAKLADGMYLRAYGKYSHSSGVVNDKQLADPRQASGGMRLDWDMTPADKLMVSSDYFGGHEKNASTRPVVVPPPVQPTCADENHYGGGNALARWDHTFSATSNLQLQAYYYHQKQYSYRSTDDRLAQGSEELENDGTSMNIYDLDLQHTFAAGDRNSIVWGLNSRYISSYKRDNSYYFNFKSRHEKLRLYSAFAQDEIKLVPDLLRLTVGSKFEYDSYTHLQVQPSIRLLYTPSATQSFWGAVSRAVRTPSQVENVGRVRAGYIAPGGLFRLSPPALAELTGNIDYGAEDLIAYELGHRIEPAENVSLDTALFYNVYDNLRTFEQGSPQLQQGYIYIPLEVDNKMHGRTYGAELTGNWQALQQWRLQACYSYLRMNLSQEKDSTDTQSAYDQDMSSSNMLNLRSLYSITPNLEFDVSLYFASRIKGLDNPSHTDLTVRLGWRPVKRLTLEAIGYNLIDNKYSGFRDERYNRGLNEVRRIIYGRVTLTF